MGYIVTPSFFSLHHHHYPPHPLPNPRPPPYPKSNSKTLFNRRSLLLSTSTFLSNFSAPPFPATAVDNAKTPPDSTVTDRVFMDFSLCPNYFLPNRTLGDNIESLCSDSVPLGRIVLGLYGHLVPVTVSNFKSMCIGYSGSSYKNTLIHKIFPGQYFLAGRQGRRDKGEVQPPLDLARNTETVDSRAFSLAHSKAGVLSLSLSENDDEDEFKLDPNYRNVEFLITTGPGPCPQLDNKNIVFGTVLEGLEVITAIASIPTYQPSERIRQFNDLAKFFGDERAQNARAMWNRPLKTVYISDCGELQAPTCRTTLTTFAPRIGASRQELPVIIPLLPNTANETSSICSWAFPFTMDKTTHSGGRGGNHSTL